MRRTKQGIHISILLILFLTTALFAKPSREEKIRKSLDNVPSSYQQELPTSRQRREVSSEYEPRRRKSRPRRDVSFHAPAGGGAIVQLLFYLVIFVAVAFLIIYIINRIRGKNLSFADDSTTINRVSNFDDEEPEYDISEADRLAGKGELTEAIHMLYLEVISWLQKRGSLKIKRSLTNREILHASSLSIEKTRTLSLFISLVEELYFGDYPATTEDYEISKKYAEEIMKGRHNG